VDAVTSLVEIGVGMACLVAGRGTWRRRRWLGVVLVVLGLVAVAHGVLALAR
jgi:hypothetical protein